MVKIAAGIDAQINLFEDKIPLLDSWRSWHGNRYILAWAIAMQIKEFSPEKRVVYLSAENLCITFVQSLRNNDIANFKEKMRIDVLIQMMCNLLLGKIPLVLNL